ncbi:MAG: hypothetical protein WCG25_04275 [bacterium]
MGISAHIVLKYIVKNSPKFRKYSALLMDKLSVKNNKTINILWIFMYFMDIKIVLGLFVICILMIGLF